MSPEQVAAGTLPTLDRFGVEERTFATDGNAPPALARWFVDGIAQRLIRAGYRMMDAPSPDTQVVLHVVDVDDVKPYRRRNAPTFVVAIAELSHPPDDLLRTGYPILVRALANLAVVVFPGPNGTEARFVTLEQGTYGIAAAPDDAFFGDAFERIEPLASSRLVIDNEFRTDLPSELWNGDEHTAQIERAGRRLADLDLLPAAFPIEEILSARDLRHVKLLYGIGGLSYGNVSTRRTQGDADGEGLEFWMSASGVDKSALQIVGEHVLLVTGYEPHDARMVLSVPPDVKPRRVSVDAIEHWMVYREHPQVGAILHVHAWMEGTPATEINYPCGTMELARSVAELVRCAPDPSRAVVGQRNHGLTITGHDLDEIFERIDGRIVRKVPMD